MTRYFIKNSIHLLLLIMTVVLSACAEVQIPVVAIPQPAISPKLRVYVQPLTTLTPGGTGGRFRDWGTPHEEFVNNQVRHVKKYLAQTGIYEIVRKEEVRAAIGEQHLTLHQLERHDWALARKIGQALHADYVMVMERGADPVMNELYFLNVLINVGTGKKFGVRYDFQKGSQHAGKMKEIIRASYSDIFSAAKEDLFSTAVRKSRRIAEVMENAAAPEPIAVPVEQKEAEVKPVTEPVKKQEPEHRPAPAQSPERPAPEKNIKPQTAGPEKAEQPSAAPMIANAPKEISEPVEPRKHLSLLVEKPSSDQAWLQKRDLEKALTQDQAKTPGTKLVVYDLDATEQYKPAALIFSEAIREEIFKLNKFTLVNREDLDRVTGEIALQQSGLIDDKEAVKTGKVFAANQVVTGKLGLLGKTVILQAKRVDVETFATLGLASTKFVQGHEDDAFGKMQEFAVSLVK